MKQYVALASVLILASFLTVGCSKKDENPTAPSTTVTRNIVFTITSAAIDSSQPHVSACSTLTYKLGTNSDTNVGSVDVSNWSVSGSVAVGLPLSINLGYSAETNMTALSNTVVTITTTNNGSTVASMSKTFHPSLTGTEGVVCLMTDVVQ